MPNWVSNELVITGDKHLLNSLQKQMKQPYTVSDGKDMYEGEFLLWNTIRPTDLEAYLEQEPYVNSNSNISIEEQIAYNLRTGLDWYNWNVRNWGTKWDISNAVSNRVSDEQLVYTFQTAWSPPQQAITVLASQYPELTFTLQCIDECDVFACEIHWDKGKQTYETDLPITHGLYIKFYYECWACTDGQPEDRERLKCDEFNRIEETIKEMENK